MGAPFIYVCPSCKGSLRKGADYWSCSVCGKQFEVRRGVPMLDIGSNAAFGFIGTDDPDRFLDEVEEKGWRTTLRGIQKPNSPNKLQEAIAPNRIAWKYLLEMDSSWKVLDIGAGTGGVACQIAKECSVVALDKLWVDVAFLHLRAQQDGLSQFEAVMADAVSLPFESAQYDLAIMIGSLEWVPTSWPDRAPREVQLQALREAWRILKPGGHFFLGIENRSYLGYFLDVPEQHTNMRYISLMERDEAEIFSQDLRGKPYLELTHSKEECIELLKEAGFEEIQAFWLYPNYRFLNYVIPLDKPSIVRSFIEDHLDPRDFCGAESSLYRFYRFFDPMVVSHHVGHFGFLTHRPNKQRRGR
ncbi:MAG: methyltransferase domain-containing protein [Deltaproteobacteria bacterium]|nr:methyltransferase domain-containing protein [Deltaproteobacteria bacterium]MBW2075831.1 methyltransferase domain-containing protein [Deltaproteobacteria bacterium]